MSPDITPVKRAKQQKSRRPGRKKTYTRACLPKQENSILERVENLKMRLELVYQHPREQKDNMLRKEAHEKSPLYVVGDCVWLNLYYKKRGKLQKILSKYDGPYTTCIIEVLHHHTYRMESNNKISVQHKGRVKLHRETSQEPSTFLTKTPEIIVDGSPESTSRYADIVRRRGWQTHIHA